MRRLSQLGFCLALAVMTTTATAAPVQPPKDKEKSAARAEPPPVDVELAEQLYTKLDYDKANELAERIVKQRGVAHEQLVRGYRVLAVTYAILDKEEAARDAFLQLLVFDPEYTVDTNLGPKVSAPFAEARTRFRALASKPGMDVLASVRSDGGQLRVTTRDPTHIVKKVTVGYRWTSSGEYTVSQIGAGDGSVDVGPAAPGRTRLDYYAQALDERDSAVFEAGSAQVPKSAFAEASSAKGAGPEKNAIFKKPVFWVAAGAVAVAGVTALFFALRSEDPPTSASLSPVIRCGNDLCK